MDEKQLKKYKKDSSVQKGLMKIYSNKDGSLPDISHLEVQRKSRFRNFFLSFIGLALLLSAIGWLGFTLFNPDRQFTDQSIGLKIKGAQSIASGDEVIYLLEYQNNEKVALREVELLIRYPDGFEFESASPEANNEFNTSWKLGDLSRGQTGQIEIRGKMIGEVGSIKILNTTISFIPENFSSIFKESSSFSSQITSSILELDVEGPEQILAEKKATYKISYKNNSEQTLEKIKIRVNYSANFIFQESTPEPFKQEDDARNLNNEWVIENLEQNQEGEVEIIGGYVEEEDIEKVDFTVEIGFVDVETEEFSLQQQKIVTTNLVKPSLSLDLILNGSNQNQPINFGQQMTYSLVYKYLGQSELDEVSFKVILDSDILDWETLEDKNGGVVDGNTITWGKDQISELDLVRPLDQGSIDFTIQVKSADEVNLSTANLQVLSQAQAALEKIGELEVEDLVVESNEIASNVNTDLELKVTARYFNDDNIAIGTGPLPPVVGQKTSFRIFWEVANSLNEVTDVKVTTTLPKGVEWDNKYLVGNGTISFSNQTNQVTWKINRVLPNSTFEDNNVWFDVSVTPTKQQERKLLILTDETELVGTDSSTDSEVFKTGKATTSNLEDDPIGGGRGLVIDITE